MMSTLSISAVGMFAVSTRPRKLAGVILRPFNRIRLRSGPKPRMSTVPIPSVPLLTFSLSPGIVDGKFRRMRSRSTSCCSSISAASMVTIGLEDVSPGRLIREPVTTTSSMACSLSWATAMLVTPKTDPTRTHRPTSAALSSCWLLLLVAGCWLLVAGCYRIADQISHALNASRFSLLSPICERPQRWVVENRNKPNHPRRSTIRKCPDRALLSKAPAPSRKIQAQRVALRLSYRKIRQPLSGSRNGLKVFQLQCLSQLELTNGSLQRMNAGFGKPCGLAAR